MALRILHLADLHLGWEPRFLPETIRPIWQSERDARLEQAVEWALDPARGVGMVILAGDLFEHHDPPEALVRSAVTALARLEQAGVRVVTVPGNHDEITYPRSVYRLWADRWPGLLVTQPNPGPLGPVEVGGQRVWLYSAAYTGGLTHAWPPIDRLPPRQSGDGWHIGVFHAAVLEGPPASGGAADRSLPIRLEALKESGYDYVALGHVHQHRVYRAGQTVAAYCGAPDAKDFDDPGVGFFTVVHLEGGVRLEPVPVPRRPVLTFEVDVGLFGSPAELVHFVVQQAALDRSPRALLRVRLTGVAPFRIRPGELERELGGRCLYVEVEDETYAVGERELAELGREPTVRGLLVRRMGAALRDAPDEVTRRRLSRALKLALAALEARS